MELSEILMDVSVRGVSDATIETDINRNLFFRTATEESSEDGRGCTIVFPRWLSYKCTPSCYVFDIYNIGWSPHVRIVHKSKWRVDILKSFENDNSPVADSGDIYHILICDYDFCWEILSEYPLVTTDAM